MNKNPPTTWIPIAQVDRTSRAVQIVVFTARVLSSILLGTRLILEVAINYRVMQKQMHT